MHNYLYSGDKTFRHSSSPSFKTAKKKSLLGSRNKKTIKVFFKQKELAGAFEEHRLNNVGGDIHSNAEFRSEFDKENKKMGSSKSYKLKKNSEGNKIASLQNKKMSFSRRQYALLTCSDNQTFSSFLEKACLALKLSFSTSPTGLKLSTTRGKQLDSMLDVFSTSSDLQLSTQTPQKRSTNRLFHSQGQSVLSRHREPLRTRRHQADNSSRNHVSSEASHKPSKRDEPNSELTKGKQKVIEHVQTSENEKYSFRHSTNSSKNIENENNFFLNKKNSKNNNLIVNNDVNNLKNDDDTKNLKNNVNVVQNNKLDIPTSKRHSDHKSHKSLEKMKGSSPVKNTSNINEHKGKKTNDSKINEKENQGANRDTRERASDKVETARSIETSRVDKVEIDKTNKAENLVPNEKASKADDLIPEKKDSKREDHVEKEKNRKNVEVENKHDDEKRDSLAEIGNSRQYVSEKTNDDDEELKRLEKQKFVELQRSVEKGSLLIKKNYNIKSLSQESTKFHELDDNTTSEKKGDLSKRKRSDENEAMQASKNSETKNKKKYF